MQHGKEGLTQLAPWIWNSRRKDLSACQERTKQTSSAILGLASYCLLIYHFPPKYGLHFQDVLD